MTGGSLNHKAYLLTTRPSIRWTDVTPTIKSLLRTQSAKSSAVAGQVVFSFGGKLSTRVVTAKQENASSLANEDEAWLWRNTSNRSGDAHVSHFVHSQSYFSDRVIAHSIPLTALLLPPPGVGVLTWTDASRHEPS